MSIFDLNEWQWERLGLSRSISQTLLVDLWEGLTFSDHKQPNTQIFCVRWWKLKNLLQFLWIKAKEFYYHFAKRERRQKKCLERPERCFYSNELHSQAHLLFVRWKMCNKALNDTSTINDSLFATTHPHRRDRYSMIIVAIAFCFFSSSSMQKIFLWCCSEITFVVCWGFTFFLPNNQLHSLALHVNLHKPV